MTSKAALVPLDLEEAGIATYDAVLAEIK